MDIRRKTSRISIIILSLVIMVAVLAGCRGNSPDTNWIKAADLSGQAEEVYETICDPYHFGTLIEYKTDAKYLTFCLDKKTEDGWVNVQSKTLRVNPDGYIMVNGNISKGLKVNVKVVEEEKDGYVNVCRCSAQFKGIKDLSGTTIMFNDEWDKKTMGEDYVMVFLENGERGIKDDGSNKSKAEPGDYGLMIKAGKSK